MSASIDRIEAARGGYDVHLRVAGAYNDGSDRIDKIFLATEDVVGQPSEMVLKRILDIQRRPELPLGTPVVAPAIRKTQAWTDLRIAYDRWWMAKQMRIEAAARAEPVPIQSALSNLVDTLWAVLKAAVIAWNSAPADN